MKPGSIRRIAIADVEPRRWKNGAGWTRELLVHPPGASMDDFEWRISIAEVERDGPFSAFAGIDRCIALLQGRGMRLHSPQAGLDHCLSEPLRPYRFDGELPIEATLLEGPTTDFNVMVRRGRWRMRVDACEGRHALEAAAWNFVCCWRGRARIEHSGGTTDLGDQQAAWWPGGDGHDAVECEPGAHVLLVRIDAHSPEAAR